MSKILSGLRALRALAFVCVALLSVVTMSSCSGDDSAVEPEVVTPTKPTAKVYRLEVEAQLAPMSAESRRIMTRALSDDTGRLTKTWGSGDKVRAYDQYWNTDNDNILTSQAPFGGTSTKLSGTINLSSWVLEVGNPLYFVFPGDKTEWKYTGQKGTLPGIAANYDYAVGETKIKSISDGETPSVTANPVTFTNEQAIVKFVLKNSSGNDLNVKRLTISAAGNQLVQTKGAFTSLSDGEDADPKPGTTYGPITVVPEPETNTLWVALRNEKTDTGDKKTDTGDKYVLTATDASGNDYRFSKSDITFTKGEAYEVEVNMQNVTYGPDINEPLTLEAKNSGTVRISQPLSVVNLKYSSDKVNWYDVGVGNLSLYLDPGQKLYLQAKENNCTLGTDNSGSSAYVHINCMADCYVYGNIMSLAWKDNFSKETAFPTATSEVTQQSFCSLFAENTHLINHGTRNLILPITKLPANCYNKTFYGCTGLTSIVCLATDILAAGCVTEWFSGVTTTGTFYRPSGSTVNWKTGTNVPSNWTITNY